MLNNEFRNTLNCFLYGSSVYNTPDHHRGCPVERVGLAPMFRFNPDATTTVLASQDQMRHLANSSFWRYLKAPLYDDTVKFVRRRDIWYFRDKNEDLHLVEPGLTFSRTGKVIPEPAFDQSILYAEISSFVQAELQDYDNATCGKKLSRSAQKERDLIVERGQLLLDDLQFGERSIVIGTWTSRHGPIEVYGEIVITGMERLIGVRISPQDPLLGLTRTEFWQHAKLNDWVPPTTC